MVIYKTTNLLNGKYYIGKDEKNNPEYLGSGKILKQSITKYGVENFKKEILEICNTKDELNKREKYWIDKLSATTIGYNITEGGTGGRTKFKIVVQYDMTGNYIKEWSSAAEANKLLKIDSSTILKVCKGKLNSCGGFIWSFSKKEKIDKYKDTRTIEILQYNKNGELIKIWPSIVEVKTKFGISDRHIQLTLDKTNKTAKGFIWMRKTDNIQNKITIPKREYNKKQKYGRKK